MVFEEQAFSNTAALESACSSFQNNNLHVYSTGICGLIAQLALYDRNVAPSRRVGTCCAIAGQFCKIVLNIYRFGEVGDIIVNAR